MQRAIQQSGTLHAALLHNAFCCKGKVEFAGRMTTRCCVIIRQMLTFWLVSTDVIKKLLRDKYPGIPLIAWGKNMSR